MTDSDDKLSRRYRELAREEPSAQVDGLILAASRRAVSAGPRRAGTRQWMVPASIAAVLVLGIGVSLRMQLEQPGIESSVPSAGTGEYSMPPAAEAPPQPKVTARPEASPQAPPPAPAPMQAPAGPEAKARRQAASEEQARAAPAPQAEKRLAKQSESSVAAPAAEIARKQVAEPARKDAAEPNPFADAPIAMAPAVPASPPAVALSAPRSTASVSTPPPPSPPAAPPAPGARADAVMTQAPSAAGAGAAPQAAPVPRAKKEALASDNAAARESGALGAIADPDPARELERIAKLREAGRHEEADRALTEFRRRHPDYRIPEAMWERVKAR